MKILLHIIAPVLISMFSSILGFLYHFHAQTGLSDHIESYEHSIQIGIAWGGFFGIWYIPIFIDDIKNKTPKTNSYTFYVAVTLRAIIVSVIVIPIFYLISQIA